MKVSWALREAMLKPLCFQRPLIGSFLFCYSLGTSQIPSSLFLYPNPARYISPSNLFFGALSWRHRGNRLLLNEPPSCPSRTSRQAPLSRALKLKHWASLPPVGSTHLWLPRRCAELLTGWGWTHHSSLRHFGFKANLHSLPPHEDRHV
jgi:hypothetical protein